MSVLIFLPNKGELHRDRANKPWKTLESLRHVKFLLHRTCLQFTYTGDCQRCLYCPPHQGEVSRCCQAVVSATALYNMYLVVHSSSGLHRYGIAGPPHTGHRPSRPRICMLKAAKSPGPSVFQQKVHERLTPSYTFQIKLSFHSRGQPCDKTTSKTRNITLDFVDKPHNLTS